MNADDPSVSREVIGGGGRRRATLRSGPPSSGITVPEDAASVLRASHLFQNRPNPFTPITRIGVELGRARRVDLRATTWTSDWSAHSWTRDAQPGQTK